jgi:hypothetical protein
MDGSSQKLFVGEAEYASDTEASIYLEDSNTFLKDINPGNEINGTILFDLPKGAVPTSIELHDSAFSGGATITL